MKKNEAGLYETLIDEKVYEFEKWDAEMALDGLMDIAKLIGKPLGTVIGSAMGEEGEKEFKPDMLGLVFESITEKMDKQMVKGLIVNLCTRGVLCEGVPVKSFKIHYSNLTHLFKVVKAALGVQYGDFFADLQGVAGLSLKKGPSPAK